MGKKSRRRKKGRIKNHKLSPSERLRNANNKAAWKQLTQDGKGDNNE